ncbi:MAG TPA: glycoside hydrolase family 18 protein [Bacillota bacterium]|nr:glycoside hydrolase family 18 protein [Bacillota bacterium]
MQIHVVQPGQSLFAIAQVYSTTPTALASANQLNPNQSLVVGQSLVIPIAGMYYWVQAGDSLFTIARRFNTTPRALARANRIQLTQSLMPGFRIYIPSLPKRSAEFNAYVEARNEASAQSLKKYVQEAAPRLTYLAPFSFEIQRDGSLKPPILDDFPSIATQNGVVTMLVVTNKEQDQFSPELSHVFLTNNEIQNKLLDNVIATAKRLGLRDIHWDIEHVLPSDREAYNAFLRKAADRIHGEGFLMSTALAPKVSDQQQGEWYTAHDYAAHGRVADFVVIMTYEWGYSGGPAMPVSPIDQVEKVIRYAMTKMPASKILMGQNLYGYDWTLPFVQGSVAKAVSPQEAIDVARRYNVPILYDPKAQAPHFGYSDEQGKRHIVWFEDARSIQAKFNLVKRLGLRGMSYWKLGLEFPQNWLLIDDNFNVLKK